VKLIFADHAWDDYLHWQETDRKVLRRINSLIGEIMRNPFRGTGKPEPLKHALAGYWSRRINDEHRIVYKVTEDGDAILTAQLRYHY
jgi:toxin YoeB